MSLIFLEKVNNSMTNYRQRVKLIWCEKCDIAFHAFETDLSKGMKVSIAPFAAF